MSDDPDAFMQKAKDTLTAQRAKVMAKRDAIDVELAEIDGKLSRIAAYFNPTPPAAATEPKARTPRATTGTRAPRQSGIREKVLAHIAAHPDGLPRHQLLAIMNALDKKAEQSVSNAVAALTKDEKITAVSKGVYKAN